MSTTIALLTPGMPHEKSADIASLISSRLSESVTLLPFDPLYKEGRLKARQALTTGQVDMALSSEIGFDMHVLPEAKVPVVVVARDPDQIWMAADVVTSDHAPNESQKNPEKIS